MVWVSVSQGAAGTDVQHVLYTALKGKPNQSVCFPLASDPLHGLVQGLV